MLVHSLRNHKDLVSTGAFDRMWQSRMYLMTSAFELLLEPLRESQEHDWEPNPWILQIATGLTLGCSISPAICAKSRLQILSDTSMTMLICGCQDIQDFWGDNALRQSNESTAVTL